MRSTIRQVTVFMFGAVLLIAVVAGCGSDQEGSAIAASSTPTTASESPTTPATAEDSGEISEIDAEVGDCVTLGGTMLDAEIDTATCGTTDSHYVIVAKVAQEADCATDIDQTYYEELGGTTTGVLCLDVDWVEGKCFEMGTGSDSTVQVPCTDPAGEKVLAVLTGTVDENECPEGTETYYTYDERQKVVCTAPAA
ncbi:hypothetical protein DFR67_101101 [Williamsia limnetica]|uniref:LppU protein n=1 Tax=Williamsia limnetica TaxID=882452 RepID=A0A318S1X6_WILLI|nr:hypothetical protein DFR67_101101 [Williamsia limnetica]